MILFYIGIIPTIPKSYVLFPAAMFHRIFPFVAACLLLMPSGISQVTPVAPDAVWGNSPPGLSNTYPINAYPGTTVPDTLTKPSFPPSKITLYADNLNGDNTASDLFLSQTPSNKLTKIIQKIKFDVLWTPDSGSDGLGITKLDLSAMAAFPMPSPGAAMLITPKFTTDFFDAKKTALGENETFYSTGLDFRWVRPICKNKLMADLGFGIFYSGDFKATGSETMKFPAHAAGIWDLNPRTKVLFGIIYTDRSDDYTWLPMVGIIWTPNDDLNVELMIPRLKIAQRVRWFGSMAGEEQSDGLYTAFEFGGGEWGYEYKHTPSVTGRVEYSDLQLVLGYERNTRCGAAICAELGYMFERELEFVGYRKQDLSDSIFMRLRTTF